jgi:hypothetical protein
MFAGWFLIILMVVIVPLIIVPAILVSSLSGTVAQTHQVMVQRSLEYIEGCDEYLDQSEISFMFNEFSVRHAA